MVRHSLIKGTVSFFLTSSSCHPTWIVAMDVGGIKKNRSYLAFLGQRYERLGGGGIERQNNYFLMPSFTDFSKTCCEHGFLKIQYEVVDVPPVPWKLPPVVVPPVMYKSHPSEIKYISAAAGVLNFILFPSASLNFSTVFPSSTFTFKPSLSKLPSKVTIW